MLTSLVFALVGILLVGTSRGLDILDAPYKILCIGDSITEQSYYISRGDRSPGWMALLNERFSRRIDFINRGFSGYTSADTLRFADQILHSHTDSDAFVVFLGANDNCLELHVPPASYQANIVAIVNSIVFSAGKHAQNKPVTIILLSPPPVDEETYNRTVRDAWRQIRTNAHAKEYAAALKSAAAILSKRLDGNRAVTIKVVDLIDSMTAHTSKWRGFLAASDGLHLSTAGNAFVYETLRDLIIQHVIPSPLADAKFLPSKRDLPPLHSNNNGKKSGR